MGRHWLLLTTCVAAAHGASISSSGTPPAGLADGLAAVVDGAGGLYNTSFSVGVVGSTFELGVAGGIQGGLPAPPPAPPTYGATIAHPSRIRMPYIASDLR